MGVAIDSSGNVYGVDEDERVQKFDLNGNFITKWGSYGSGDGQFARPQGIATDSSGTVYVVDTYNHRIQKFDSNGNFIVKWGTRGSGNGHFIYPRGVAVDSWGYVYVADTENNRIQKFDSNGNFITKWGSYGGGDGFLNYPRAVAIDSYGHIYVADTYNHRIQKFDSEGNFIAKWSPPYGGAVDSVAVNASGDVYITRSYVVQKFAWVLGLAVVSPNGGEGWKRGTTQSITWNYAGNPGTDVKIDLYKGGMFNSTLTESTLIGADGSGYYDWQIPGNMALGTDYRIRISSTTDPTVYDESNMNFTIRKTLVLASPNGSEGWDAGTTHSITWTYVGNPGPDVRIDLYKGGTFISTIVSSTSSGSNGIGSYKWTIPLDMTAGSDYQVKISSISKPDINDISDSNFAIASPPTMTLTSPNGGEIWSAGILHTITWTYTGDPDPNVKVILLKGGAVDSTIASSTSVGSGGSGSCDWLIPAGQTVGSDYKVKVMSTKNGKILDSSYGNFRITAKPSLAITYPNGEEIWSAGTTRKIKWTYTGNPDPNVKIDLYRAGAFDSAITSSVSVENGSYAWSIPSGQAPGLDYQIHIASTTNSAISDMSDLFFEITGMPVITVTSPNGGEIWPAATTRTITWTYTGKPNPYVKIELYKGGTFYSLLTGSTAIGSGGTGSYNWSIPPTTPVGSNYQIRITSTINTAISDISDGNFTVGLAGTP